jgi:hypothetical protein
MLDVVGHLVLSIEVKEYSMGSAAGIIGHPEPIQRDLDARLLERTIGFYVTCMQDRKRLAAGVSRSKITERVSGVLPQVVFE